MKVHGLNKARDIIERDLRTKMGGVYLDSTLIEKDAELFWDKLWSDGKHEGFTNAFIQITNRCNKKCPYCYNRDLLLKHPGGTRVNQLVPMIEHYVPDDDRGVQTYKDFTYEGGNPKIGYLGGEPTIAKSFVPLLHYLCSARSNKQYVYTNGIKLVDMDYLKSLPNTNQIMFAISCDEQTDREFLDSIMRNLEKFKFEYGFSMICKDTEHNQMLHDYFMSRIDDPNMQEIRYRAASDQRAGRSDFLSDILRYMEKMQGIDYDTLKEKLVIGRGGMIGAVMAAGIKLSTATIPVWGQAIAEQVSRSGSFVLNTTVVSSPGECHMNSAPLYRFRMGMTDEIYTDSLKPIWGTWNHYMDQDRGKVGVIPD